MNFEELIATLSKGSATAVMTLESNVAELNALKEYLSASGRKKCTHHVPRDAEFLTRSIRST